jgi:RES domain-containing protein
MDLWRLCRRPLADLSGRGGELAGGRWHTRGRPVVYAATSAALAVLEVRVHLDLPLELLPGDCVLARIEAPDDLALRRVRAAQLAPVRGGHERERQCRAIGDAWLRERQSAILLVPSGLVPVEGNALINPRHAAARRIVVAELLPLVWEGRPL